MKKFISMLICLTMLLSVCSVNVLAAVTEYTKDEITALNLETPLVEFASVSDLQGTIITDYTPEKYMFKVAGSTDTKGYVLLRNVNAGENDGYFVMVADTALTTNTTGSATKTLDTTYPGTASDGSKDAKPQKQFDATEVDSIAYYLNQQSYIDAQFPAMKDYINNHTWYTERTNDTLADKAYSTDCKIALLSTTEYQANIDRIGVANRLSGTSNFILRTPHWSQQYVSHKSNPSYSSHAVWTITNAGKMNASPMTYYWICAERPCFYLSANFFKNVKLDMSYLTGKDSEVGKLIKSLDGVTAYTQDELNVMASVDVASSNGNKLYTTLTAPTYEGAEYQWYRGEAAIDGATSSTYTTVYADLGTSVSCKITVSGMEITTPSVAMEAAPTFDATSSNVLKYTVTTENDSEYDKADPSYVFNIADSDVEFILLESVNADESDGVFVLRKEIGFHKTPFYEEETTPTEFKYDPADEKSIAYKINQQSYWDGTQTSSCANPMIPTAMQSYINDHRWWVNPAADGTGERTPYAVTSKVAIISFTELARNAARIGYNTENTEGSTYGWFLRNNLSYTAANGVEAAVVTQSATAQYRLTRRVQNNDDVWNGAERICFYLNPDFFKSVKLDIENMGANVKTLVKEKLETVANARAVGYSTAEMKALGFEVEDFSAAAEITAENLNAGTTVTGTATINQRDYAARKVEVIVAAYDANGVLIGAETSSKTYTAEDFITEEIPVSLTLAKNAASVKCYVWDGNLAPLMTVPAQYPAN